MASSVREPLCLVLSVIIELNPQAGLLIRVVRHELLEVGDGRLHSAHRRVVGFEVSLLLRDEESALSRLGILRLGSGSVEFGMWMTKDGSGKPLCRARITTAAVDMRTMQKRALPEPWRTRFSQFALREEDFPSGR